MLSAGTDMIEPTRPNPFQVQAMTVAMMMKCTRWASLCIAKSQQLYRSIEPRAACVHYPR